MCYQPDKNIGNSNIIKIVPNLNGINEEVIANKMLNVYFFKNPPILINVLCLIVGWNYWKNLKELW
jgi:hypothetical protein